MAAESACFTKLSYRNIISLSTLCGTGCAPIREAAMIWSTQSKGVRRLSLVAGIAAELYYFITLNQPHGPPAQKLAHPWQNPAINLANLAVEGGLYFLVAWLVVRVIGWVVAGFITKR